MTDFKRRNVLAVLLGAISGLICMGLTALFVWVLVMVFAPMSSPLLFVLSTIGGVLALIVASFGVISVQAWVERRILNLRGGDDELFERFKSAI